MTWDKHGEKKTQWKIENEEKTMEKNMKNGRNHNEKKVKNSQVGRIIQNRINTKEFWGGRVEIPPSPLK